MPHLVREVGVGGNDIDLSAGLLELCVVVCCVFDFSRAVEGESGRHKNEDVPLTFEGLIGNGDELAIVESLVLESLDLRIDKGHDVFFRLSEEREDK
jgi:hypothetical protein